MSIAAFKSALDSGDTRAKRIAIMASDTDALSGIINLTTKVNKAYVENAGSSGNTGTAVAAIVDVMDVLTGRTTDQSLDINGKLKISSVGIGIGTVPVENYELAVVGDILMTGDAEVTGDMAIGGLLSLAGGVALSDDGSILLDGGAIQYKEALVSPFVDSSRDIIDIDEYSNTVVRLMPDNAVRTDLDADGNSAGFAIKCLHDSVDKMLLYTNYGKGLVVAPSGIEQDEIGDLVEAGLVAYDCNVTLRNTGINASIKFEPAFVAGEAISDNAMMIDFFSSSNVNTCGIRTYIGEDNVMTITRNSVVFNATSPDFLMDLSVKSDNAYWVTLHPNRAAVSLRKFTEGDTLSVAPALRIGGAFSTKSLRLGFDSYDTSAIPRLHMDIQSLSGCIPAIAIGKPLGNYAAPLDALVVMDSPFMTIINGDLKAIRTAHSTKEGLFIGKGNSASTHKAGRIWLEDATSQRASIQMGTEQEPYFMFMKNGSLMTKVSSANPNNLGTASAKGAHMIPLAVVQATSTDTPAQIVAAGQALLDVDEVESSSMIAVCDDDVAVLCVFSGVNWLLFKSAAHT